MQSLLFSFNGRVNRAKWWLLNIVLSVIYSIVTGAIVGTAAMEADPAAAMESVGPVKGIVLLVVTVAVFWSGLAIAAKRWHDRGKSAWWILIAFVPVIGGLWYLIECGFLKGTTGPNRYGPDPIGSL